MLGRFFTLAELPASGSRETLYKRAHELIEKKEFARYGSQSRHISDLSDEDSNYFLLFGGQDGWLGSQNYSDQINLWQDAKYLKIPLSHATVKNEFTRSIHIVPN